ncbi:DUF1168-domain-containing protein [Trichocladium antarcticum]|uniref:DUF1168-domain-containing protein n=1 Tax=Trichocladium antarcticum TaxID=1450529 RepID=A0AAN6ZD42_9PEZI|nr:DUF1168-domain-containing protein [Trichocladium antarcticum]
MTNPPPAKRPRRALSPASAQAASLQTLFKNPDHEIHIPLSATAPRRTLPAPPEIVTNVQGSSAGAGSGEFHVYKAARRREYERLRQMDEDLVREKEAGAFARRRAAREREDAERTRRRREKRGRKAGRKGLDGAGEPGRKDGGATGVDDGKGADGKGAAVAAAGAEKAGSGTSDGGAAPVAVDTPGLIIHDDD